MPSTALAYFTDKDMVEATRAAGAMLIAPDSSTSALLLAASIVHGTLTFFWASILTLLVPRENAVFYSCMVMILVGIVNLSIIAPLLFPSVAALSFWPQMMDHAALGFCFGIILRWRFLRRVKYRKRHA